MMYRLLLAAFLTIPCLPLVGCGSSTPGSITEPAGTGDPSSAEMAKVEAEQKQVAADERAVQASEAPAKGAKGR